LPILLFPLPGRFKKQFQRIFVDLVLADIASDTGFRAFKRREFLAGSQAGVHQECHTRAEYGSERPGDFDDIGISSHARIIGLAPLNPCRIM